MKVRYQFARRHSPTAPLVAFVLFAGATSCGLASYQQSVENGVDRKLSLDELTLYMVSNPELEDIGNQTRSQLRIEVPKAARETRREVDRLSYVLIPLRHAANDYKANVQQFDLHFDSASQKYTISYQTAAESQPNDSYAINGTGHCTLTPDADGHLAWAAEVPQSDEMVVPTKRALVPTVTTACRALLAATTATVCRTLNERLRLRPAAPSPA